MPAELTTAVRESQVLAGAQPVYTDEEEAEGTQRGSDSCYNVSASCLPHFRFSSEAIRDHKISLHENQHQSPVCLGTQRLGTHGSQNQTQGSSGNPLAVYLVSSKSIITLRPSGRTVQENRNSPTAKTIAAVRHQPLVGIIRRVNHLRLKRSQRRSVHRHGLVEDLRWAVGFP